MAVNRTFAKMPIAIIRSGTISGFASMAAALGFSKLTISGLLGHAARGVTQRYIHLDTALVIAADQVATEIARLLAGGELQTKREIKQARTLASLRAVA